MPPFDCSALYEITQRWATQLRPTGDLPAVKIKRLPRPSYDGDNGYNGFTGAERRKTDQVLQVLERGGIFHRRETCDLCRAKTRIFLHGEDYFDPFSMACVCFGCHMAIHNRYKSVAKWQDRLNMYAHGPYIADFRALPMQVIDFAGWLRGNTSGPHDVVKRIWPDKIVLDYSPMKMMPSGEPKGR